MPPSSRGKGASAKTSGPVLPLSLSWGGGRGGRRGSSGGAGGAGAGSRPWWNGKSALLAVGLLLSLVGLATLSQLAARDKPAELLPLRTQPHLTHATMPVVGDLTPGQRLARARDGPKPVGEVVLEENEGGGGGEEPPDAPEGSWKSDPSVMGPGSYGYPLGEDDIHVVFSTDCSNYQAWQAVVLFHSAILSGHMGPITQLVSGCTEEEEQELIARHQLTRHTPKHRIFFSPGFVINNPTTGEPYPYMNKPNAMNLWLNATEVHETIVALIDPDFIFLKPLTTWMSPSETVVRGDGISLEGLKLEKGGWVRKGCPAGQRFILPNWTHWDRSKICPEDSACATASTAMAKRYYDLIPPYLAHKDDWARLLPEWVDQAPKVYEAYPSLLAEQTAYATAAATLNLRHYRLNNFAIENEKVDYEPWDAIDHHMENVCDVGIEPGDGSSVDMRSFDRMPFFIHYCHMYRVGAWLFNKRRYRKEGEYDQLSCDTPLLETPPMDVQTHAFKMHPGAKYESITPRSAKRNAFMLCVSTRFVNSALRRFKQKMCVGEPDLPPNFAETERIA